MKKSKLIIGILLASFILTAFAYKNWSSEESYDLIKCNKKPALNLVYDIDSRFMTTITKDQLHNAKSIVDILPEKATHLNESYSSVKVSVLHENKEITEFGKDELLNQAQINLMKSTDYSNDIIIKANYKRKNPVCGRLNDDNLVYYITIVPEKQAKFMFGQESLIKYLREKTKEQTSIITQDQLKPGKVNFTIAKNGKIKNVKLESTSGYSSIDESLIELIKTMPETWEPATNSKGDKVDQELVFFFGKQGC